MSSAKKILLNAGFTELSEKANWNSTVEKGKKYFVTRNGSSIIAFGVGAKWNPGNGIAIVGAHTDSPTLRVKPKSKSVSEGYQQVGVEVYGGGLWSTWFDRDLSVAGRVYVKSGAGSFSPKVVSIDKPILRIPSLAIHLERELGTKFEFNKEKQLKPIMGLVEQQLNGKDNSQDKTEDKTEGDFSSLGNIEDRHHNTLLTLLAKEAQCDVQDIQDFELVLYDTQKSVIGGINDEFVFSPRLDNLASSFCAVTGLVEALEAPNALENEESIVMISLFDHEEIGSVSAQGAASNFQEVILSRLAVLGSTSDSQFHSSPYQTFSKSFLISADMAHAVHPNYQAKHEDNHRPSMNKGPTIKINANQRYATNSPGILLVQECANEAKVPLQLFVVRNDSPCGSTIGPIMASNLGIRTLDIGNPQLAMHSVRETCGSHDVEYAVKLFSKFFQSYTKLEAQIEVDN